MTEPLAYMWKTERGTIIGLSPNDNSHSGGRLGIPLYTEEQLHPRVKMTHDEFDEFKHLYLFYPSLYNVLYHVNHSPEDYPILNNKLFDEYPYCTEAQNIFSNLHNNFDPDKPEETIEIVPNMKWFVRSKKCQNFFLIIADKFVTEPYGYLGRDELGDAQQFDTKEEAEEWTNPLTEAVQLPVEGE